VSVARVTPTLCAPRHPLVWAAMRLDRRRLRILWIVAAGVIAAALGLVLGGTAGLDDAEALTVDQRFQIRGEHDVPDNVVVVGIDDTTLATFDDRRPPYPRSMHATAIRNLTKAGARVIAYDIQFSEPTSPSDAPPAILEEGNALDVELLDALTESKRVVLGTAEVLLDPPRPPAPNVLPDYEDAAAAVGVANFADGTFRRLSETVDGLPTFAVAVAQAANVPVNAADLASPGALIDYHGKLGTIAHIPFSEVVSGRFTPEDVRDKIVVVGNTSNTLGDVHRTPFEGLEMSGPEINANAISTLLRGVPLRETSRWLNVLVLLGLVALATLTALRRSALVGILAAGVLIGVFLWLAQLAFNSGRVLDVAAPVIATGLTGLVGLAINYWFVNRDRARLRTDFARFLPGPVVDDVIAETGPNGRLGGRRLYATVMFADLRGFTAAAERLPPEMVIDVLNRYLTEMSDAVLDHGGTLVAYQGDGLMAVFGAPIEQPDHADRAIDAAREMREVRLPRFNAWATTAGIVDDFRMGIGLASGPVMSGNVGSERRLEYATVGDTTNTAARLEAMTKETPHMLLIADTTRAAASRSVPDLTAVGSLDVRGRQVPASVWTLAEMATGPAGADPVPVREPGSS
jgi:adenylate cyclase